MECRFSILSYVTKRALSPIYSNQNLIREQRKHASIDKHFKSGWSPLYQKCVLWGVWPCLTGSKWTQHNNNMASCIQNVDFTWLRTNNYAGPQISVRACMRVTSPAGKVASYIWISESLHKFKLSNCVLLATNPWCLICARITFIDVLVYGTNVQRWIKLCDLHRVSLLIFLVYSRGITMLPLQTMSQSNKPSSSTTVYLLIFKTNPWDARTFTEEWVKYGWGCIAIDK